MAPRRAAAAAATKANAPPAKPAAKAAAPKKAATTAKAPAKRSKGPVTKPPVVESEEDQSEDDEPVDDESADDKPAPPAKKAAPKKVSVPKKAAPVKKAPAVNGTKAAAAKAAPAKPNGLKRKADEPTDEEGAEEAAEERPIKKPRQLVEKKAEIKYMARPKRAKVINHAPTARLDVFVFGEGSSGELGLGSKKNEGKKPIDVKRPRINHHLDATKVGVVQIACGGMHAVALTHDNKVLTWGVNDDRALGRDTFWEGGTRDVDAEDSDDEDDDDTGVNPRESTPGEVDMAFVLHPDATLTQVAATDSASFVLTDDGLVYGWGTFRGSDGIVGWTDAIRVMPTPTQITELKNITRLACGSNHVLALDNTGKVFTWGVGGQFQLGRKTIARRGHHAEAGLKPEPCGRFSKKHHAVAISAGSYHSFYIDNNGKVWGWGLNNFSQTGLSDRAGVSDAMIETPTLVKSLEEMGVKQIAAGEHHTVACTADGKLLTWGRVDGHQSGHKKDVFTEDNAIFDEDGSGKPRILVVPTAVEGIKASFVAAGTDNNFSIDDEGHVYSWGFSANYQTGQGTIDDIETPTVIDNSAVRDRHITWAGAGGQYSIIAAPQNDVLPNGN